jgi:hypothetical protein
MLNTVGGHLYILYHTVVTLLHAVNGLYYFVAQYLALLVKRNLFCHLDTFKPTHKLNILSYHENKMQKKNVC